MSFLGFHSVLYLFVLHFNTQPHCFLTNIYSIKKYWNSPCGDLKICLVYYFPLLKLMLLPDTFPWFLFRIYSYTSTFLVCFKFIWRTLSSMEISFQPTVYIPSNFHYTSFFIIIFKSPFLFRKSHHICIMNVFKIFVFTTFL